MKKITLQELNRIRDRYKSFLAPRKGEGAIKVIVHMGTCGIASGAREVMSTLLEEMSREDAPEITVAQSGCIGLCDREPIVTVIRSGESPVRYYRMNPEKMRRVFQEHLIEGKIVKEFTETGDENL